MPESDLIQQLDQAVEALLHGAPAPPMGKEVTALMRIAADVRALPDSDFRAALKARLMEQAGKEKQNMAATTTPVNWIPKGFHTLTPYLHASAKAKLMDFLRDAFGAVEAFRVPTDTGTILHAQTQIGDSIIEFSEIPDEMVSPRATSLRHYVESVDETYRRALAAGAESLYAPVDQSYGDREAGIKDPAGNVWFLARARSGNYKHPGLQDVAPYLLMHDTPAFIDFLQNAFGAEVLGRHEDPQGIVLHASLRIGDSIMGMGEAHGKWPPMPGGIHHYVPNVDEVYRRALAAGGKSLSAPSDTPYGDRYAGVADRHGNYWYLATHLRDYQP